MTKNVEIYTLDYCPYCMKAKIFFEEHKIPYTEISCEEREDDMRIELMKKYALKEPATFPQIVINGENIGGYSELIEKYENKLIDFN